MSVHALGFDEFSTLLTSKFDVALDGVTSVAVAVSGGPDSMALYVLLSDWARVAGVRLHALHVDHNLRAESGREAEALAGVIDDLQILKWNAPSETRLQEAARHARYCLMAEYCAAHDVGALFLGHHMDDQAETFLFRLAKGSGLDGLAGMQPCHVYDDNLVLCRPLLSVAKERLIETCVARDIDFLSDPSNENDGFSRVRLRQSREVLEGEGLSAKRLSVTAKRLLRAREALEVMSDRVFDECLGFRDTKRIEFNAEVLRMPEEIVLRVVLKGIALVGSARDYAPRMERVETLVCDLLTVEEFRARTLGGVIIRRDDKAGRVVIQSEA